MEFVQVNKQNILRGSEHEGVREGAFINDIKQELFTCKLYKERAPYILKTCFWPAQSTVDSN